MAKRRLRPDRRLKARHGLIAPNGDFYGCDLEGHSPLVSDLYHAGIIKTSYPEGYEFWIKVQHNDDLIELYSDDYKHDTDFFIMFDHDKVTQSQMDTMFDWCQKHGRKYPAKHYGWE